MNDKTYKALYPILVDDYAKLMENYKNEASLYSLDISRNNYNHFKEATFDVTLFTLFEQESKLPITYEELGYPYIPYKGTMVDHTEDNFGVYDVVIINWLAENTWLIFDKAKGILKEVSGELYLTNNKFKAVDGKSISECCILFPTSSINSISFTGSANLYRRLRTRDYLYLPKEYKNNDNKSNIAFINIKSARTTQKYSDLVYSEVTTEYKQSCKGRVTLAYFIDKFKDIIPIYEEVDITDNCIIDKDTTEELNGLTKELNGTGYTFNKLCKLDRVREFNAYEDFTDKDFYIQIPVIDFEEYIENTVQFLKSGVRTFRNIPVRKAIKSKGRCTGGEDFYIDATGEQAYIKDVYLSEDNFNFDFNNPYNCLDIGYIVTNIPCDESTVYMQVSEITKAISASYPYAGIDDLPYSDGFGCIMQAIVKRLCDECPDFKSDFIEHSINKVATLLDQYKQYNILGINYIGNDFQIIVKENTKFRETTLSQYYKENIKADNLERENFDKTAITRHNRKTSLSTECMVVSLRMTNSKKLMLDYNLLAQMIDIAFNTKEQARAKLTQGISMAISNEGSLISAEMKDGTTSITISDNINMIDVQALAKVSSKVGLTDIIYGAGLKEINTLYLNFWRFTTVYESQKDIAKIKNIHLKSADLEIINNIISNHVLNNCCMFHYSRLKQFNPVINEDCRVNFNLNKGNKEYNLNLLLTLTTNEFYVLSFISDAIYSCNIQLKDGKTYDLNKYEVYGYSIGNNNGTYTNINYESVSLSRFITSQVYNSETAIEYLGQDGVLQFVETYFDLVDRLSNLKYKLNMQDYKRYLKKNEYLGDFSIFTASRHTRRYYATALKCVALYTTVFREALTYEDKLKYDNRLIDLLKALEVTKKALWSDLSEKDLPEKFRLKNYCDTCSDLQMHNLVLEKLCVYIAIHKGVSIDWSRVNITDDVITAKMLNTILVP